MSEYEPQELAVEEKRRVSLPSGVDDGLKLLDAYPKGDGTVTVEMDQDINTELYTVGGDGNPIHYDQDFVQAYDDVMPFFDGFPDDALIVQGSAFIYESVRNSRKPVSHVSSRFMAAVDTTDAVIIERELAEDGEVVNVYLEDGDLASTHELTYDTTGVDEATARLLNTAKAEKVPRAVGADDQLNNLLLEVDADLGDGYGDDWIAHADRELVEDNGPVNLVDTYAYEDDTTVTLGLLQPHPEMQDEVIEAYNEKKPADAYSSPLARLFSANVQASTEAFQAVLEGRPFDAFPRATRAWVDVAGRN